MKKYKKALVGVTMAGVTGSLASGLPSPVKGTFTATNTLMGLNVMSEFIPKKRKR